MDSQECLRTSDSIPQYLPLLQFVLTNQEKLASMMTEIFPRQLEPFAAPVDKHRCKLENQLCNKENKKKTKIIRCDNSKRNLKMSALSPETSIGDGF